MVITLQVKSISEKFRGTGNCFNVRIIFKTFLGTLMETGLVRDAQHMMQCVYNIPCECGRCYITKTSSSLEACIKKHKYNLTQGLLEKSKLAQCAYEVGHKICWKEAKVF
jgi:hypothetical protein